MKKLKGGGKMCLNLDYFCGKEAEQFQFYRIPQLLFTDDRFKKISSDAKILYGLLLDRIGLSFQNSDRFTDSSGRTFIYFTRETTMEMLNCGKEKSASIFQELEKYGLIERKNQGLGKPIRIYVKNIFKTVQEAPDKSDNSGSDFQQFQQSEQLQQEQINNYDVQGSEEPTSRGRESRPLGDGKTDVWRSAFPDTNHTNINHTKLNHTDMNQSISLSEKFSTVSTIDEKFSTMTEGQTRQTQITFAETLADIGCYWMPEAKSEKEYANYSIEERYCKDCQIPYHFKGNTKAMKYSLQYLFAYSYYASENNEFSRLMKQVIESIAEMTKNDTYQVQGTTIKYYEIIDKLNEINQENSLINWFLSFEQEWKKILGENQIKYQKAYMKSCIWNWLNEYQFTEDNYIRQLDYKMQHKNIQEAEYQEQQEQYNPLTTTKVDYSQAFDNMCYQNIVY